ncbi:MAG: Vacuolar protein sorting-associated protein 20 [Bathelium mastoideum]|nr:MAG: Vacuolar protein sorting-associated protein 20 [Bathelium mastoideum]
MLANRAILDMKNQRDKLHQYQKRIRIITDRETEIARECLRKKDVERAKLALRRKKYQETLLANTDKSLAQLEILTNDIEFALVQKDVLFGLQQGTSVLKEIQREMGGVEKVEQLMGVSEEARAYQEVRAAAMHTLRFVCVMANGPGKEISDMLGGKLSHHDEDEVDNELEAMEMELAGRNLPNAPDQELAGRTLPSAPDQELPALPEANARILANRTKAKKEEEPMLA